MPYKFVCPVCKRNVAVRFLKLNEKGTCPVCGKSLRVPADATEIDTEEAMRLSKDLYRQPEVAASSADNESLSAASPGAEHEKRQEGAGTQGHPPPTQVQQKRGRFRIGVLSLIVLLGPALLGFVIPNAPRVIYGKLFHGRTDVREPTQETYRQKLARMRDTRSLKRMYLTEGGPDWVQYTSCFTRVRIPPDTTWRPVWQVFAWLPAESIHKGTAALVLDLGTDGIVKVAARSKGGKLTQDALFVGTNRTDWSAGHIVKAYEEAGAHYDLEPFPLEQRVRGFFAGLGLGFLLAVFLSINGIG